MDYLDVLRAGELCFVDRPGCLGYDRDWPLRDEFADLLPEHVPAADVRLIVESMPHVASVLVELRPADVIDAFPPGSIGERAARYFTGDIDNIWATEAIEQPDQWEVERLAVEILRLAELLLRGPSGFHAAVDGPISIAMGIAAVWDEVERLADPSTYSSILAAMAIP